MPNLATFYRKWPSCSCAWYPTMRLFRQRALGDWAGVIDQMRAELLRVISPGGAAVHSQGGESLESEPAPPVSALEGRQEFSRAWLWPAGPAGLRGYVAAL